MWSNCAAYNADGSDIMVQCNDCRRAFETAWRLEGLPTDPATWQPAKAAELREDAARRLASLPAEQRAALTAALAGAPVPQLQKAAQQPRPAAPAPAPVPAPAPARAPAPVQVAAVAPVPAAAPAPAPAPRPQQQLKRKMPEGGPASGAAAAAAAAGNPAGMQPQPRAPPAAKRSRGPAIDQGDWQTRATQALARLMQLEASEPFHEPVRSATDAAFFACVRSMVAQVDLRCCAVCNAQANAMCAGGQHRVVCDLPHAGAARCAGLP